MAVNSDFKELGGRDPHAVLGVQRDVSKQEVARAFRRSAAQGGHPDMGGDDRTFRQLTRARDILLDPRRLTAYNATRQATGIRQGRPEAPRGPAGNGTRAEPHRSSVSSAPAKMNAWTIITLVLVLLGPLLWPAAIVTGLLALGRTKRSGQGGDSRVSVSPALLYALSILVLPSVLTIVVITIM